METATKQTIISVIHEVKDFDEWKKAYLDQTKASAQDRLGILRHIDNPNLLCVGEKTNGHDLAKEFFSSEDLQLTMENSGVITKPELFFLNFSYFSPFGNKMKYRLTAIHEVEDYQRWKSFFDRDEELRESAGLTLTALGTNEDNPNEVHIMFATENLIGASELIANEELQEIMKEAGVISIPRLDMWTLQRY